MRISERGLNRSLLGRQLLLGRERLGVVEAVRRVVALQAQHAGSPYIALWNRLTDFDPVDLDGAFARYEVVRATLMRVTMHAVHSGDYRAFREAMDPTLRAARITDDRFRESGLTPDDADALISELLDYADQPRTTAEAQTWLEERVGAPLHRDAWRGFRGYTPWLYVPTGPPWSFGNPASYITARPRPALLDRNVSAASLRTLVRRYLEGFGPASLADVAQFALTRRAWVKEAMKALAGELERLEGPGGAELFDVPGAVRPAEDTPAPPRLMAMWDSVLLACADRSRVIPPDYRALVIRVNGDVLPTVLVDGYVAGVWRPFEEGIEVTAFHCLPDDVWEGLAAEARALVAFLSGREPDIYRQYDHWWRKKLPGADVRVLRGR